MAHRSNKRDPATFTCPQCGTEVAVGRSACPECGSDASTGWRDAEDIDYQSVEIPDVWPADDVERRAPQWFLVAAVLAIVAAFVIALAFGRG